MPYASKAQQRWAHTASGEKALGGPAGVKEWDEATDFDHLPERANMATHEVNLGKKAHFKVKEGSYHAMLGIPEDQKIPKAQEEKDAHSSNLERRRKAISALGFRGMRHGG